MKQIKSINLSVILGLMMVQGVSALSSQKPMYALNPEAVVKQMSDNRFNQQASNQILNSFMSQMQQLTPAQRAPYAQSFERAYSSYFPGFIAHYDAATNQLSYEHLSSGVVARSYGTPAQRNEQLLKQKQEELLLEKKNEAYQEARRAQLNQQKFEKSMQKYLPTYKKALDAGIKAMSTSMVDDAYSKAIDNAKMTTFETPDAYNNTIALYTQFRDNAYKVIAAAQQAAKKIQATTAAQQWAADQEGAGF
ncbi:MAG TPA: hypothetical protein VLG50_01520 [Candidatus Saccharimonadales bacterium]|nr:hypothetical protein [Candidatus Saccharimonadales bacterium]